MLQTDQRFPSVRSQTKGLRHPTLSKFNEFDTLSGLVEIQRFFRRLSANGIAANGVFFLLCGPSGQS
jgi:hypothetical protein